jgi:hypothetical protein
MPADLNATGMLASEKVHLGEIVVISGIDCRCGQSPALRLIACRPAASSI